MRMTPSEKPGAAAKIWLALLLGSALVSPAAAIDRKPSAMRDLAARYVAGHEKTILTEYTDFLALPNVASTVPDVEKNAAHIATLLEQRGFTAQQLSAGPGTPPAVYGELKVPGARRTVLFYAHYDGQPVSQSGWESDPFKPVMRTGRLADKPETVDWRTQSSIDPEWRLYARSASDDKASIQALLSALDALKAQGRKPSVNIKVFYEGEEEQSSPHLAAIMDRYKDLLACDLIVLGDGPMHSSGRQQVSFGSRGVTDVALTVFGPLRPLHDGHYGNWAPSPSVEITHLLAGLREENGDILIPGFYDDVRPVSPADRQALDALPASEGELQKDLGIAAPITDKRLAESYFRPALNVRAIHVGDTGPSPANAIATTAYASIDIRLVPYQTPARVHELFEAHLRNKGWLVVDSPPDLATRLANPRIVMVKWDPGASVAVTPDLSAPATIAAAAAIERVEGAPILRLPMVGASSGLAVIVQALKAPMITVSIVNFDNNQHAENENLRIGNLWDGIAVYTGLLADLKW